MEELPYKDVLRAEPLSLLHPAYRQAKQLYLEAFPDYERIPMSRLTMFTWRPEAEFLGYFDEQQFVGFAYVVELGRYLYILYLAVEQDARGHGYGSRMLDQLREMYPDHLFVLEIEPVEPNADNYDQRVARQAFYERNGFSPAGFDSYEDSVRYTMLILGDGTFDVDEFTQAARKITHGFLTLDIRPA